MANHQAIADAADISAVTQLVLTERESRDLGRWDRMRACYLPDSHVRLSWFDGNGADFVIGSIDMAKRNLPAKHRLGPVVVRLAGTRAVASLSAIIDIPTTIAGTEATLSSHARFLFRAEQCDDAWGLAGFDAVYLRDEIVPALPGASLSITAQDVAHFRPSYRMLAYVRSLGGYSVHQDLAGEDRADLTDALYAEVYGWAGLAP